MIVYKNVPYEFNWALWNDTVSAMVAAHGIDFIAEYIGVSPKTVDQWMNPTSSGYADFKHPNMSNFLKVISECAVNPANFFTTGE